MAVSRRRLFAPQRGFQRVGGFYGRYSGKNAELKFFDTVSAPSFNDTGATFASSLCLVPQGVTENTRVGRKMVIKKIHGRYTMNSIPAVLSGASDNQLRLILIWDKQANGDAPVGADILEGNFQWNSYYNLANSSRFVTLHDWMINFQGQGAVDNEESMGEDNPKYLGKQIYKTFHKTCNIPIEYDGTTGDLGTIKSNNIVCFAMTRFSGATGPDVNASIHWRIRFSDG